MIYGTHGRSFLNTSMTQQGQGICLVGRGISSGLTWFGEGPPLVHRRIRGSIQEAPWIASGSQKGAKGEQPWIVCLRKTTKNTPRYGCRAPLDMGNRRRLMHSEVDQGELSNDSERSGVDRFGSGHGLGEPEAIRGDPYLGPWASEAIRFGC